jgi:hypothetical protein
MRLAVVIPADAPIRREEISDAEALTDALGELVGGDVEELECCVPRLTMFCNRDGKLLGLPINHLASAMANIGEEVVLGDVALLGPLDASRVPRGIPVDIAQQLAPRE